MPKRTSDIVTDRSDGEIADSIDACLSVRGFNRTASKDKNVWRKGLLWSVFVSSRVAGGTAHVEVWNHAPVPGMGSFLMYFMNMKRLPEILEAVEGVIGGTIVPAPRETAELRYAGFWRRAGAALIDLLLLYVVTGIIAAVATGLSRGAGGREARIFATSISTIISLVGAWLYFAVLESSSAQATLGKQVLGIKVGNERGERVSFGKATGRYWSKCVSALILGIGFVIAAFTGKKQALHDLMAGTVVVRR